jgi:hypothetical protein
MITFDATVSAAQASVFARALTRAMLARSLLEGTEWAPLKTIRSDS